MKKNGKKLLLTGLLLVMGIGFWGFKGDKRNFQLAKNLEVFHSVVRELDLFYVDTLEADKLIGKGIDAMLAGLDPYTVYYPEDETNQLEMMTTGKYAGVGSLIRLYAKKKGYVIISEPYENMPAAEAGLKAGDILLEVDGKDMKEVSVDKVINLLRGEAGTSLTVKVERPGVEQPLEFKLTRRTIQMPSVPYYGMAGDSTGYILLTGFTERCSRDVRMAVIDLKKQGARRLVLDLRSNGGGLLSEAVEIVNLFVPRGVEVVSTKGKVRQASSSYRTAREPLDVDIPLAVLVDGQTASAAEIVSGALQDLDRAVVVGYRTYGKGLVQVPRELPYNGMLKVTTSKYYIPSGRCIQAIDYAHRNEDGSVGRIPDSLTTVFHTAAGREVRDGGGVTPDVELKTEKMPNLLYYLVNDEQVFDFATQYCAQHATIAPVEEFEVTDAMYEAFKEKVKDSDFTYDRQSEKALKALKEVAEFEGYLQEATGEFAALESKFKQNLERDLDFFAKDIKMLLADEIVKRYYYERGSIVQALKDDEGLKKAKEVLGETDAYTALLRPKVDTKVLANVK